MSNNGTNLSSISPLKMPAAAASAHTFTSTPPSSASPSLSPALGAAGPFSPRPPAYPNPKSRLQRAQTESALAPRRPLSRAEHDSAPSSPAISSSTAPSSPLIQNRSIQNAVLPVASSSSSAYNSISAASMLSDSPSSSPVTASDSSSPSISSLAPSSASLAVLPPPEPIVLNPEITNFALMITLQSKADANPLKKIVNLDFSQSQISENGIYTYRVSPHIQDLQQLTVRTTSSPMNKAISHLLPIAPNLTSVKILYYNQDPTLLNAICAGFENRKYAPTFNSLEIVFTNPAASLALEASKNALLAATSKTPAFQLKFS